MIVFSKFTLSDLMAIGAVMDDFMREDEKLESWKFSAYVRSTAREAFRAERAAIDQHVRYAAEDHAGAPPAEDPDDLQALVDTLSRCSDQLVALAAAEDKHFAECSQTEVFNKVTMLRECKQALNNMVSDIRDHYDGLH